MSREYEDIREYFSNFYPKGYLEEGIYDEEDLSSGVSLDSDSEPDKKSGDKD